MTAALGPGVKARVVQISHSFFHISPRWVGALVVVKERVDEPDPLYLLAGGAWCPPMFEITRLDGEPPVPLADGTPGRWLIPGLALRPIGGEGLGDWDALGRAIGWDPRGKRHLIWGGCPDPDAGKFKVRS